AGLEVVARFQTVVTDDVPAARAAIRQMMGPYFATSVYNRFVAWCGFAEEARAIDAAWRARDRARNVAAVTDDMVDRLAIIGTPEHCRERLAAFVEAGGTTPTIQPFLFDEAAIWRTFQALSPAGAQAVPINGRPPGGAPEAAPPPAWTPAALRTPVAAHRGA